MRFTKTLVAAMIIGMPAVASADPIASALSATFCSCGTPSLLLSPTSIAVSSASGDTATAAAVASIVGGAPSSGALASGSNGAGTDASITTTGSVYETFVVIRK